MIIGRNKILRKYFLIGFLFGLLFPIGAILLQMFLSGNFGFQGIIDAHIDNPLIYMIDSAPLFLGGFALIGGISQAKSEIYAADLLAAKSELESSIISREETYEKSKVILSQTSEISDDLYDNLTRIENSMTELYTSEDFIKMKSDEVSISISHILGLANKIADKSRLEAESVEENLVSAEVIGSNIQSTSKQLQASMVTFENDVKSINDLSDEIDAILGIIRTIHGISSDIKLLSLNASIEASRAGEHGRGFAVVADEVRSLSDASTDATSKIEDISKSISLKTSSLKGDINNLQIELNSKVSDINEASSEVLNIIDMLNNQKKSTSEVYELTINQKDNLTNMNSYINDISTSVTSMSGILISCQSSIAKNEEKVIELKLIKV